MNNPVDPKGQLEETIREILNQFAFNLSLTANSIGGLDREEALEKLNQVIQAGIHRALYKLAYDGKLDSYTAEAIEKEILTALEKKL